MSASAAAIPISCSLDPSGSRHRMSRLAWSSLTTSLRRRWNSCREICPFCMPSWAKTMTGACSSYMMSPFWGQE